MINFRDDDETIAAVATATGHAGLAVVRISGPKSVEAIRSFMPSLPEKVMGYHAYYGKFFSLNSRELIDDVVVTIFLGTRSFTGQESVEISTHGSPVVINRVLNELVNTKLIRLADPGEFTYRAVLNNKIDLIQAESVLDLINSTSQLSAALSVRQLKGELSTEINQIIDKLTWVNAHLEANIDFSDEDIEVSDQKVLVDSLLLIQNSLSTILSTFISGQIVKNGLKIVLCGAPNVGKSSFLNAIVKQDRSIVTDQAGTTRDTIEVQTYINGVLVNLIDTAGLRMASDKVEQIGIQRAQQAISNADLVFYLYDCSRSLSDDEIKSLCSIKHKHIVYVGTKNDLVFLDSAKDNLKKQISTGLESDTLEFISINTVEKSGTDDFYAYLEKFLVNNLNQEHSLMLLNARHAEALTKSQDLIKQGLSLLNNDQGAELVVFELQMALEVLYKLVGQRYDDQVMDRVFKEFCLGK